jgi:hypothetical protein
LLDGGMVFVPEFVNADENCQWIMQVAAGHDPQLQRAIEELLKVLPKNPGGLPPRPAPPVKAGAP